MVLTAMGWLYMMFITWHMVSIRMSFLGSDEHYHLWDIVPRVAASFSMTYIVCVPYVCWASTAMVVDTINHWTTIEVSRGTRS